MQAAAPSIKAEHGFTVAMEMQVQHQVGVLPIHRAARAPSLPLQVHQGVFYLKGCEMTMVEGVSATAHLHLQCQLWGKPMTPVDGLAHSLAKF
jgi:hypothetical protein